MALITTAFYEDRYGSGDSAKLTAHIADVSAEVVDYVNSLDNDSDDPIGADNWDEDSTPATVQAVVARVVNRGVQNPLGVSGEQLGDHNYQMPAAAAGGTLAPKDRKIIRRAVSRLGVSAVTQEGFLPTGRSGLAFEDEFLDSL